LALEVALFPGVTGDEPKSGTEKLLVGWEGNGDDDEIGRAVACPSSGVAAVPELEPPIIFDAGDDTLNTGGDGELATPLVNGDSVVDVLPKVVGALGGFSNGLEVKAVAQER
jgi:hypothetical protein